MISVEQITQFGTVLLVDDDPILLEVGSAAFQSLGMTSLITASSGTEALEHLEARGPEIGLIVSDLQMPGMDGMALFRALKSIRYHGALIVLSSMDQTTLSLAQRLAANQNLDVRGVLKKPINLKYLTEVLRSSPKTESHSPSHYVVPRDEISIEMLRTGIAEDQITPYFQPKISVATGVTTGAEALARWQHPELGFIAPNRFIALAEQSGLIFDLTDNILRRTLFQTKRIRSQSPQFRAAVNLSADLTSDLGLPDRIMRIVGEHGLAPDALVLEITESQLLNQSPETMEVIGRLHLLGFDLSIDDYGTGQSNLTTLSAYPFAEMKIDRSFINSAPTEKRSRALVTSCVELGRALSMRIVAEGIETKEHMSFVTELGIDQAQGYWISKPQPPENFQVLKFNRAA